LGYGDNKYHYLIVCSDEHGNSSAFIAQLSVAVTEYLASPRLPLVKIYKIIKILQDHIS